MMNILRKLHNLIKLGRISGQGTTAKQVKIHTMNKDQMAVQCVPYGMFVSVPTNNFVLLLNQDGFEDSMFALQMDLKNVDSNLQSGEIKIGIPTKTGRVYFKSNGDIKITDDNNNTFEMTTGEVKINGTNLEVLL